MQERIKYLFRQYLENKCTRREFDEFFALLRDASHDESIRMLINNAYREMEQDSVTYVDESGNLVLPEPEWFSRPIQEEEAVMKKKVNIFRVVGILAALVAGVYLLQLQPVSNKNNEVDLKISSTERSEYKYLLLPDSTQVWLNAASTLEYPPEFGNNRREVFLSGEAYFDVKHAAKTPFIIHTGKISTTVLGTAFNIKAYNDLSNVTVAVSRGKVKVEYLDKVVATLTSGQQVKVNNHGNGDADRRSNINTVAAWQQGNLVYDDESIMDIVADLERMYNVIIKVKDITVNNMRISTSFNRQTGVEQALQIICSIAERKMMQKNGQYIIY